MVTPDATHRPAEGVDLPVLCVRCSRHHPSGRACFPRVRWVSALCDDLAEAARSLRGMRDALRGDREPTPWGRRAAIGGGVVTVLTAALRAAGIL